MKRSKPTISMVLATYNEENNIVACLKAVKPFVQEMIVVDGSSSDKTRSLARKHGAKVYKTTNKPIFHINKNIAIRKASGDWILQMDADEIITPKLGRELRKVASGKYHGYQDWKGTIKYTGEPPVAYWIKRVNYFLNHPLKKSGQYPDPVIRFFKRGKAILPAKDVHEQMQVDGPTAYLKHDMEHYASPTFSRYLLRENRYSTLQAQHWHDQKVTINALNSLNYLIWQPLKTFFLITVRHKGYQDGFPGLIFSFFSALHFPLSYIKLWELSARGDSISLARDWD